MLQQQRINPASQFGLLIGIWGFCFIAGNLAALPLWKMLTGVSLLQNPNSLFDPAFSGANKIVQSVSSIIAFALPALVFSAIVNKKTFAGIGFNITLSGKQVFLCILLLMAGLFVSGALSELTEKIPISKSLTASFKSQEDLYTKSVMAIATMKTVGDYLLALLVIALLPAICEELLFRASLQNVLVLWTRNALAGILITSAIFSLVHFSYYGFLSRLFLGLLLGYVYYYSKNIWLNIFLHFFNNALVVTNLFSLSREGKLNVDSLKDDTFPIYLGVIGIAAVWALLKIFKKESEQVLALKSLEHEEDNEFNIH